MNHEEATPIASLGWSPTLGETTTGLAEWLVRKGTFSDISAFDSVRQGALAIVRSCLPFQGPDGAKTGLVVGYVQSGKTVSMEAVSAIASDSGCRIVVLLAGVTTNLLEQNADRFTKDLRAAAGRKTWKIFNSQSFGGAQQAVRLAVEEWKDKSIAEEDQQTILLLVLKNHAHLERLRSLLASVDLHGIPALVLDDEADQAGLNTAVAKGDESTTYKQIGRIRKCLPHHTYLQYTATPQAPLLIALDDMLSPAFAELVEPGKGYTGGQSFFGATANSNLVRTIPADDLFKPGSPPDAPPESMLEALRVFLVGCVVRSLRHGSAPRSMLIHPSPRKNDHRIYLTWVQEAINSWSSSIASSNSQDRADALEDFQAAYLELQKTDNELPEFGDIAAKLLFCMRRLSLKEVNSEDGTEIDWDNASEHILVGGEKLNRGFTVEGLSVTYMPRDAGDWNADTIQQRARFFGYKEKYLSLCRLYLHPDVIHAFRAYVRHEEDVRSQLSQHRGKPLRAWRRAFFMDAKMRPTRKNVLADPFFRVRSDTPWFVQEQPHLDLDAAARNMASLLRLESLANPKEDREAFDHKVAQIELASLFSDHLLSYEVRGSDVPSWYGQLVTLRDILESTPNARALLVRMKGPRKRSATNGEIKLHQGHSSAKGEGRYPGDAKIVDGTVVTLQIHLLDVDIEGQTLHEIPAIALHIPSDLRRDDVVTQDS